MPTFERTDTFKREYQALGPEDREKVKSALRDFINDLTEIENGVRNGFRPGLRVMPMRGWSGIWEMTWEIANGRATFQYGEPIETGKRHIVWRRIGGHDIYLNP